LNDNIGPKAIWYGGALIGFAGVITFLALQHRKPSQAVDQAVTI
jgi:hypothetical protein